MGTDGLEEAYFAADSQHEAEAALRGQRGCVGHLPSQVAAVGMKPCKVAAFRTVVEARVDTREVTGCFDGSFGTSKGDYQ